MNYPTAVPRLPSPSMMPVTVDVASLFSLSAYFYPRSAAHVTQRIWCIPPKRSPRKNKLTASCSLSILLYENDKVKQMTNDMIIATHPIGDLFE